MESRDGLRKAASSTLARSASSCPAVSLNPLVQSNINGRLSRGRRCVRYLFHETGPGGAWLEYDSQSARCSVSPLYVSETLPVSKASRFVRRKNAVLPKVGPGESGDSSARVGRRR